MADDNFKKPGKIEHEALDQESEDLNPQEDSPLATEYEDTDPEQSMAEVVIEEYGRTIEFMKWIEEKLREAAKVEVEIDPEDDPEVWMAMNRVFSNPSPKMNQESYFQAIDGLEVMERLEQMEDDPRNGAAINDLLDELPGAQEVDEGEITDEDFQISAVDEIEEKAKVQRKSALKDPPPPPPPPKPPEPEPWLRRWRKYYRRVNILGRPMRVQWLRNRWWRDKINRRR